MMTKHSTESSPNGSRLRAFLIFGLKLLALVVVFVFKTPISQFLQTTSIPPNFIDAVLLFVSAHLIIDFLRISLIGLYNQRHGLPRGKKSNFALGIQQIATIATFMALVIAVLSIFNIHIREVLTAISIVAAAIAILSKDYVSNMINGMIIMFSDDLSLNDYIKIGNQKGRVVDITLLSMHLMNEDDDLVFIPNSKVLTEEIINYTKRPVKKVSIDFEVSYAYLSKVEELEDYLITVLSPYSEEIIDGSFNLKVVSTQKDSALFKFQYILKGEADKRLEMEIRKLTIRKVIEYVHRQKNNPKQQPEGTPEAPLKE